MTFTSLLPVVLALLTLAGLAAPAAHAASPLQVTLSAVQTVVQGDGEVAVDVQISNPGAQAVRVLKWALPEGELHGPLFKVTRADGRPAPYLGPLVKRAAPQAGDYVEIAPGASLSYRVDLARRYQLDDGQYSVEYRGASRPTGQAKLASGNALQLWTSGRTSPATLGAEATLTAPVAGLSYVSCNANRRTKLVTAVADATTYATGAANYLQALRTAKPRYTTWFGTYGTANRDTVKSHFNNEVSAFTTQPLKMDCSCTDSGVYAYVYPSQPYRIYLCGAFWAAPARGTDSKAGTLVHEMSHFTVVGGTDDYAYGQTAAQALAISNPQQAIMNADSHEYFAENRPAQH